MELKAGIGTSSRVLAGLGTLGVLVLANFGALPQLRLGGAPVGGDARRRSCRGRPGRRRELHRRRRRRTSHSTPVSSPASPAGSGSVSRGLGSVAGHGSGDIFCAFSTTNRRPRVAEGIHSIDGLGDDSIGALFTATVDATEEAVSNALFVADTVSGRDGHVAPGLPVERVLALLAR